MASLLDTTVGLPPREPPSNRPQAVKTAVFAASINGTHTDFAVIVYSNRVFLTVTQLGKIGNLFSVHRDTAQKNGFVAPSSLAIYDIKCVLGVETEELSQAIRSLAERLDITKPLLVSLTLNTLDYTTVSSVCQELTARRCW